MLFTKGNLLIIRVHPSDRATQRKRTATSNRLRWHRWLNYVPNVNPKVPTTDIDLHRWLE